jgi:antitoxin HicB
VALCREKWADKGKTSASIARQEKKAAKVEEEAGNLQRQVRRGILMRLPCPPGSVRTDVLHPPDILESRLQSPREPIMENLNYTIVLEPSEAGGYTVTVPALPPVVTEGDTYEEAIAMAKEAIGLYLQTLRANGREISIEEPPHNRTAMQIQVVVPFQV